VTRERFAMAVAHYMRTLIPDQAPIDLGTMTQDEVLGFEILRQSGCYNCHSFTGNPTLLTQGGILSHEFDNLFSNGFAFDVGFGPVKTPTLRNVGLRQRFFSSGLVPSLDELIDFYEHQPFGLRLWARGRTTP
jgi:cytochrome c peroxidase